MNAIESGLALLTWEKDAFAYADSYDESEKRYRGLKHGGQLYISADDTGLLVKPEVARQQVDAETAPTAPSWGDPVSWPESPTGEGQLSPGATITTTTTEADALPRHGCTRSCASRA